MVDPAPVATLSVTARDHTETRALDAHLGDVINVKGFGAVGDGVADDTLAIQEAFDTAFGTWADPHGGLFDVGSDMYANRPVFFPTGNYNVSSAIDNRTITGAANNGSGLIRLTVDTTGLVTGDNVHIAGVVGTTEANFPWFVTVIDATHLDLRVSQFFNTYVSGGTLTTPCLRLRAVQGGRIYGAGRDTNIRSMTANAAVICTNAFAYSKVENLTISTASGGIGFQLDWIAVNVGPEPQCALQSNTFQNMLIGGGKYGLMIGAGSAMGSETAILNCYIGGCSRAGVSMWNYNACDNTMVGGNIASCGIGILVASGSINTIHGVSFQANTDCDIDIINAAEDAYSIAGCRTESTSFCRTGADMPYNFTGCAQAGGSGFFWTGGGYVTMLSCKSPNGYIQGGNASVSVVNCKFERSDWLTFSSASTFRNLTVVPMLVTEQTGATYTIQSHDSSSKIRFNRATAQAVTVPNNADTTLRLQAGGQIAVQQAGVGQVTFAGTAGVTIRSAKGLKMRAQYSCAMLTCDGENLWTLDGDTTV